MAKKQQQKQGSKLYIDISFHQILWQAQIFILRIKRFSRVPICTLYVERARAILKVQLTAGILNFPHYLGNHDSWSLTPLTADTKQQKCDWKTSWVWPGQTWAGGTLLASYYLFSAGRVGGTPIKPQIQENFSHSVWSDLISSFSCRRSSNSMILQWRASNEEQDHVITALERHEENPNVIHKSMRTTVADTKQPTQSSVVKPATMCCNFPFLVLFN